MTGRVVVTAVLHIDCGHYTRPWAPGTGRWVRFPTADFRCVCGYTEAASGDHVRTFVRDVRAAHAEACTARKEGAA